MNSEDEAKLLQRIQNAFQKDIALVDLRRQNEFSLSAHDVLEFWKTSTWTVDQVLQYIKLLARLPPDKLRKHPHPKEVLHEVRLNIVRRFHEISDSIPSVDEVLEFCEKSKWNIDQVIEYIGLLEGFPEDTDDPERTLASLWSYRFGMR